MPKKKKSISYSHYGVLFILPFFIVFGVFQLFPILYTFSMSFLHWDGIGDQVFAGLSNYERLITDRVFRVAVANTFRIWLFAGIPQIIFALFLGALFSYSRIRGKSFFQAVFYLPNLITATSIGIIFSLLMDWQSGTFNHILRGLGLIDEPIYWLVSETWTAATVSFIQWWQWFGYTTLIVMAGMKAIPDELYEAARIDGARSVQMYFRITLPLLKNTLTYVIVTAIIGGMQIFDVPAVLTDGLGAPNRAILTMVMYLYNTSFRFSNYGYGAAVAYGIFGIVLVFSIIAFRQLQRRQL